MSPVPHVRVCDPHADRLRRDRSIMSPVPPLSRRDFLRVGGVAGAGALLTAAAPGAAPVSANDRIAVALVGFGAQGRVLMEAMLKIPFIRLVAICDIWDYARDYGVKYLKKMGVEVRGYADHETLLAREKDVQAVVVATADIAHAPVTIAALKDGRHVYCEKMMSNTVEGARSMVRAMRETGRLLQIGHQRRSNPRYRFIRDRLFGEAKLCGRLTAAQAQWNRAVTPEFGFPRGKELPAEVLEKHGYRDMRQFRNWRWFKHLGGGPLSDLGAHQIDIFNWIFDAVPTAVMASGGRDYFKNYEWYDQAFAVFEYARPEGPARALYETLSTTSAGGGYFEYFMGDEGSIRISENPRFTAVYREAHAPKWDGWVEKHYLRAAPTPPAPVEEVKVDVRESAPPDVYEIPVVLNKAIHQPHLENFFNAVRGREKLNCPADEAFRSERVVFKANEAIEARRTLELSGADFAL